MPTTPRTVPRMRPRSGRHGVGTWRRPVPYRSRRRWCARRGFGLSGQYRGRGLQRNCSGRRLLQSHTVRWCGPRRDLVVAVPLGGDVLRGRTTGSVVHALPISFWEALDRNILCGDSFPMSASTPEAEV